MITADNLIEAFAKLRFYKWHSINSGKWVVFEALPEEPERNTKRTSSFETEDEADTYLEARKLKFIADLKARIECKPIVGSGQVSLEESSTSTTKSSTRNRKKPPTRSFLRTCPEQSEEEKTNNSPSPGSETSPPF